jgi:hypothetical protein
MLQFSAAYVCEVGSPDVANIRTSNRVILKMLHKEMRVTLLHVRPNIQEMLIPIEHIHLINGTCKSCNTRILIL